MSGRRLDIGPGKRPAAGFETLDVVGAPDYKADARALPFGDDTFEIVHASHVIEHIPWYQTDAVLSEWVRVLQPGGVLEVWTVDAAKVARALIDYEDAGIWQDHDGWKRLGADRDPYLWCAGRLFAYAKTDGDNSVNWHRALFTPRHLQACLGRAGLGDVRLMHPGEVRGKDHGWINLGARGVKPCA